MNTKNAMTNTTVNKNMSAQDWLKHIAWDDKGLVPAIAQDHKTGKILMVAWMNREALLQTVQTREAVYFSRSRAKLWHKGEESGHTQSVKSIRADCDGDVIVLAVEQHHGIACHTGRESCFFNELVPALNADGTSGSYAWQMVEPVLKNPETMYTAVA